MPDSLRLGKKGKGPAPKPNANANAAAPSSSRAQDVDGKSGARGAASAKPNRDPYSPPCTRSQNRRFEQQIQDFRGLATPKKPETAPKARALKGLENLSPAPKGPSAVHDAPKSKQPGKDDVPKSKQPGKDDAPKSKQPGKDDAPKSKQPGKDNAPKSKQPGKDDAPKSKQPGKDDALKQEQPSKTAKQPAKGTAGDAPGDPQPKVAPNVKNDPPKPQEPAKSAKPPAKGRTAATATQAKTAAAEGPAKVNRRAKKGDAP